MDLNQGAAPLRPWFNIPSPASESVSDSEDIDDASE
jgi:hypothetical protein